MPEEVIITHSAEETTNWGRQFARRVKAPVLVLLTGDLGTGKTTLTKGIVAGLGAAREDDVTSPTFTLVHIYGKNPKVYHADLYRYGLSISGAMPAASPCCKLRQAPPAGSPLTLSLRTPSGFLARPYCGC